jgi:hypothetical protein
MKNTFPSELKSNNNTNKIFFINEYYLSILLNKFYSFIKFKDIYYTRERRTFK